MARQKSSEGKTVEQRLEEVENFCVKLIDALAAAEKEKPLKDSEIFLLPEGNYFGKEIK